MTGSKVLIVKLPELHADVKMGNDVFAQASILSSGAYRKGTWASLETYAMIAADGTITLHTSSAFDGAVLLIG